MVSGLIIDNFAGGGGASTGIEAALGRSVDVAINHDAQAVAMHRVNHPGTRHYCQSVWRADPLEVTGGKPVALAWFSPDCKHFSKAKGGKPVEKNIRDLAWVVVMWAKRVRPAVIMLENVEEFQTWGPLTEAGQPCPDRKGETFKHWKRELQRYGYRLDMRELRACDYGGELLPAAPTIRKRLFIIARCDGLPIVWPARTHGPADHPDVIAGKLKPWRVAADIIDWSLPCPSIFDTAEEIMAKWGLRAQRPLASATLRRIARGVTKYVLNSPRPFIVRTDMASAAARNGVHDLSEPVRTQTTSGSFAVVSPVIVPNNTNNVPKGGDEPVPTITTGGRNMLVAPTLVQTGYGERQGQAPRALDIEAPIGTQVAGGGKHAVIAAFLAQHNTGVVGHDATEPVSTLTSKPGPQGVVAVHMTYAQQGGANRAAEDPLHTLTASAKDQNALVAANLIAVNHGDSGGSREYDVARPVNTQTARRGEALIAAHLQTLRGSDRRDASIEDPLRTVSAGGNHSAVIAAFLSKFYSQGDNNHGADEPFHTMRTRDSCGLVTVEVEGETYAIADIGMRMLTPRERFRAQGFPDNYIIDHGLDENGEPMKLTLDAQGRMCGNSVCPPLAEALVRANVVAQAVSEAA
jgi:DNA (cytosine-5)-methyltransferase 1